MPAILLTGRPGCGKTTIIREAVRALGVSAGGFYTEEVRSGGRRLGPSTASDSRPTTLRTGFDLVTLDGRRACLASVHSRSPLRVSKYGVELEALDGLGAEAIRLAIAEAALVVIDEIGKMELYSDGFRQAVLAALDSGKPILGSIMLGPHPFADAVKRRPDVQVVNVTQENRREIAQRVFRTLKGLLAG